MENIVNAPAETGRCLCGACRLSATPAPEADICHCGFCRKWSGGMFIGVASATPVTFNDDAPLGVFQSSAWGERVFCRSCGSSLVWRSQDGAHHVVSVQVFDDPGRFPVESEIFIDKKPASYALAGPHRTMTEAEFMAQFAPQEEG
ncbi:MAG: GFA family protein [Paracoccus sp. (in: a-proteobacteria)]|nr:GFA family protein [Paracoccus sp. (in: a-proteobacteria)]